MRNLVLIFCFFIVIPKVVAQEVSLSKCVQEAKANSHLLRNESVYRSYFSLGDQINQLSNYPRLSLNGKALYQSDVVEFDFDIPIAGISFPQMPHAQYQSNININQRLYDWGLTDLLNEGNALQMKMTASDMEIISNRIEQMVNGIYLAILLSKRRLLIQELVISTVQASIDEVSKAVDNGVLLPSDLHKLQNLRIEAEQERIEINAKLGSLIGQLNLLTDLDISKDDIFSVPETSSDKWTLHRPENMKFTYQQELFDIQSRKIDKVRMPQMVAFSQFGYGRPGLNFLSDQWDTYFIGGISFDWEIWDYGRSKKMKNQIRLQQEIISNQEKDFNLHLQTEILNLSNLISATNNLIIKDVELVENSAKITKSSKMRLTGSSNLIRVYPGYEQ
ncbi:MAG: TolC family protein [Bacteroidales bacterium]|nr:TolC family protein [Bacteroidales bacterium]